MPTEWYSGFVMYQIVDDCEPLFNEEHPCPQHKSHHIIDASQLGFSGAPAVQFLFVGHIDDPALANGHNGAGMTLHVGANDALIHHWITFICELRG